MSFAQEVAQESNPLNVLENTPDPCADIDDDLSKLECSNPSFKAVSGALDEVWGIWTTGINAERIGYLREEQMRWESGLEECGAEGDRVACLQARYEERVRVLSEPRIFQSESQIDGQSYVSFAAMTPLTYKGLNVAKDLSDAGYAKSVSDAFKANVNTPPDEECALCTYQITTQLDLGFDGANLAVIEEKVIEVHDDQDPINHFRSYYFDKTQSQIVELIDLFDTSTAPFAKNALIENVMSELNRLNNAVSGNESGETRYFWNETEANLQAQNTLAWSEMGFCPEVENGKIMGFKYRADSYEFAPYGSSDYFSGFYVDSAPIVAYLKPQYRENFK